MLQGNAPVWNKCSQGMCDGFRQQEDRQNRDSKMPSYEKETQVMFAENERQRDSAGNEGLYDVEKNVL